MKISLFGQSLTVFHEFETYGDGVQENGSSLQVIHYIRQDKISKEIADLLNLSARTIESYREKIRIKTQKETSRNSLHHSLNTSFCYRSLSPNCSIAFPSLLIQTR